MNASGWRMTTIALVSAATLLIGCEGTTSTGYDYTMKVDRELQAYFARDPDVVYQAALDTLQSHFKYRIDRQARDRTEGIIEAKTAKDDIVRVETYRDSDFMTRVEVFVGPMGDDVQEKQILDAIANRLRR